MWPFSNKAKHDTANIETGLKAIDLLVPHRRGDDVLVRGDAKAGAKVLGNELAYRLMNLPARPFRVFIFLDSELDDLENRSKEYLEIMPGFNDIFIRSTVTASEIRELRSRKTSRSEDAMFCISENDRFVHIFEQSVHADRAITPNPQALTSYVVTETEPATNYDARIVSSRLLAQEAIYPALDVRWSSPSSQAVATIPTAQRHVRDALIAAFTPLLSTLVAGALKDPNWQYNSDPTLRPAAQALRFLSQPYFTAEIYTGMKAAFLSAEAMVKSFRSILDGKFLETPANLFLFKNELPS